MQPDNRSIRIALIARRNTSNHVIASEGPTAQGQSMRSGLTGSLLRNCFTSRLSESELSDYGVRRMKKRGERVSLFSKIDLLGHV